MKNICKVKKFGNVKITIEGGKVSFFNEGDFVFSMYTYGFRLQELSGIIRDSFLYYGLEVVEGPSVVAGWIKGNV